MTIKTETDAAKAAEAPKPDDAAKAAEAPKPDEVAKAAQADAVTVEAEAAAADAAEAAKAAESPDQDETAKAAPKVPSDIARAATKRAEANKGGNTEAEHMIAALQAERLGYEQRGNKDRVAQVDESIKAWQKRKA